MKKITKSSLILSFLIVIILTISCRQNIQEKSRFESKIIPTPPSKNLNTEKKNKEINSEINRDETQYFFALDTCKKLEDSEERLLCETIVKDHDLTEEGLLSEFSYLIIRYDLNNDNQKDAIIWINDMCGTSGCPFSFYQKTNEGFQRVFDEFAWTPIILLNSSNRGWKDVAYQIAGGGVEPHYVILQFDGKSYKYKNEQKQKPKGKILLDKNWKESFFGPIPNK